MADDEEYLEILDSSVAMARDAADEAQSALRRVEAPAAVLLNYAERIQTIIHFLKQRIPSRWRVDLDD